jgi:hypothetical protein
MSELSQRPNNRRPFSPVEIRLRRSFGPTRKTQVLYGMSRAAWPLRCQEVGATGEAEVRIVADLFPETASPARVSFTALRLEPRNLLG